MGLQQYKVVIDQNQIDFLSEKNFLFPENKNAKICKEFWIQRKRGSDMKLGEQCWWIVLAPVNI